MNLKKTIVLCLDIDGTLINFEENPGPLLDFNGSNQYGDASVLRDFLTEVKKECEDDSFDLIVQIISAKLYPDVCVHALAKHLHVFLSPLNTSGEKIRMRVPLFQDPVLGQVPVKYCYMSHNQMSTKLLITNFEVTGENKARPFMIENLLPSIHLCRDNNGGGVNSYSKKKVMNTIYNHLNGMIPSKNFFMWDNDRGVVNEVSSSPNGYQGVWASGLDVKSKPERTIAFHKSITVLKSEIKARRAFIKLEENQLVINGQRARYTFSQTLGRPFGPFFPRSRIHPDIVRTALPANRIGEVQAGSQVDILDQSIATSSVLLKKPV